MSSAIVVNAVVALLIYLPLSIWTRRERRLQDLELAEVLDDLDEADRHLAEQEWKSAHDKNALCDEVSEMLGLDKPGKKYMLPSFLTKFDVVQFIVTTVVLVSFTYVFQPIPGNFIIKSLAVSMIVISVMYDFEFHKVSRAVAESLFLTMTILTGDIIAMTVLSLSVFLVACSLRWILNKMTKRHVIGFGDCMMSIPIAAVGYVLKADPTVFLLVLAGLQLASWLFMKKDRYFPLVPGLMLSMVVACVF